MKNRKILIKEIIIKNNQPIELWIYSPIVGVIYVSSLIQKELDEVNQEINGITFNKHVEIRETLIA